MASLIRSPNGRWQIQFVAPDEKRKTLRLGKVPKRSAEEMKRRAERLLEGLALGEPMGAELASWVKELPETMANRLARVGLIPKRERREATTLGDFLDAYVARRIDVKSSTKQVWANPIRNLKGFFGPSKSLADITVGDAEDFRLHLISQKLSSTTTAKRLRFCRQFFRDAMKRGLVEANPFADVKEIAVVDPSRSYFVTREEITRLMNAAPDAAWRAIIALARFAGMRCPSEVLELKWGDIDWQAKRITVTSPKTAHHPGKGTRAMPLFAELYEPLCEAWELAEEGELYVVSRYRKLAIAPGGWRNANLRTQFMRIIQRAGLQPWPRLFHAMRSSRETELVRDHPIQCVTAWLGNTPAIALKHYLQVTDHDWDKATEGTSEAAEKATHNPTQYLHVLPRNESQDEKQEREKPRELPRFTRGCDCVRPPPSGDERARTANPRLAKPVLSQLSYVPSRATKRTKGISPPVDTLF